MNDDVLRVSQIISEIMFERRQQIIRWGNIDLHEPVEWLSILTKQVGQAASIVNGNWELDADGDYSLFRHELIQAAAVIFAAIEDLDAQR